MLTVAEAQARIREAVWRLPARVVSLSEACGCMCAGEIRSPCDLPPWDKSLVDGFALRSEDGPASPGERVTLRIVEEIPAGRGPREGLRRGDAARIFTGAPLPPGADAVVMQEHAVRDPGGDRVVIDQPVRAGQNRLEQGRELKRGTSILATGTRIGPIQIGILASTGHGEVPVFPRPRISILSTGDELRPPGEPGISLAPGQIWDSNGPMLEQLARSQGFQVVHRSLASDEATELRPRIEEALRPGGQAIDLLILTGGVSVGDRDLVPGMLMELGVQPVFHKLKLKPGKPLWFGVQPGRLGESSARAQGTLVFGLPGNPVSVLVGFLLFVAPAGRALGGEPFEPPRTVPARLGRAFVHRGDRPTYHPARLALGDATEPPVVEPLEWAGSPDLFTLTHANGFVVFPAGDRKHDTGELVEFLPLP